jgi:hypothetical protein
LNNAPLRGDGNDAGYKYVPVFPDLTTMCSENEPRPAWNATEIRHEGNGLTAVKIIQQVTG